MHSSGNTSLAVGLSPYKIAKKDVLASKLAGRFFHHFAWLVAFTKSSQKISTHLLTVLIIRAILHIEQRGREKIKDFLEFGSKNENNNSWHICQVKNGGMTYVNAQCIWKRYF